MHVYTSFQVLTFILLFWYSCLRWWWFKKAPTINPAWDYSWANAPINMFTAFSSIGFLSLVLFGLSHTISSWLIYCLGGFLLMRNVWYSIEDIYAYMQESWNTQKEQAIFVLLDLLMVIEVLYWASLK